MIPGQIISLLTFPGVIAHELAHLLFCKLFNLIVTDVCYFRFGNPAGFVEHEEPMRVRQNLIIGIGPFIFNTLLGAMIAFPAAIPVIKFESASFIDYFLIWLGVSIAMHSFPSTGDAKSMWESIRSESATKGEKIAGIPIVGLVYLGALGSIFWLDLLYGIAVAAFLPNLVISLFV